MNTIGIVGEAECGGADIDVDPWIPLKVTWWPRGDFRPLYLFISGVNGGHVELKVDPYSGALEQLVVIVQPPASGDEPAGGEPEKIVASCKKTPVIDRSLWDLSDGYADGLYTRPVDITVQDLWFDQGAGVAVLRLSDDHIVRYLRCDDVSVGLSADRLMVSVEVRLPH